MNILIKFLLLTCLIVIIVEAKSVKNELPTKQWWQRANFYQLYPRSFKDSNGDGIGDLKGMIANFDHLKELGITATWLSPIFASPQKDLGYDVSDFYKIDEAYGDMKDFEALIERAHNLSIKIMLDYIPNHTSDQHQWFQDSVKKVNGKDDYYVWRNGTLDENNNPKPPNNWVSVFGGPAWTYRSERNQWYLHQFTKYQPDLNYRNPKVKQEMTEVIKFYLDKGVDGFRLDAINHMFEDDKFLDEPLTGWGQEGTYDYLEHIYTKDQNETYDVVYEWRDYLEKYTKDNNLTDDKILMTEAYASIGDTMRYYESKDGKRKGAHMPFNFELIYALQDDPKAPRIKEGIENWLKNMPTGHTPSWVIGSHDHSRVATRIKRFRAELANTLLMTLPGTSITYYGEEISMSDNLDFEIVVDNRDPCRTPMQWTNGTNAGFSEGEKTWLPVNRNYEQINVEFMKDRPDSIFHQFTELTKLRNERAFLHGGLKLKAINDDLLVFERKFENEESYVMVANINRHNTAFNLTNAFEDVPQKMKIVFKTSKASFNVGDEVDTSNMTLGDYAAVILRSRDNGANVAQLSIGLLLLAVARFVFMAQ
ncbi:alpha-glucosidase-like [Culicoides brevitarsis]|uniref:alpha-glucosidase-like n=1 Tax=Culicoides brevitarsis TaxID=469753 RepID=UPI00307BB93B